MKYIRLDVVESILDKQIEACKTLNINTNELESFKRTLSYIPELDNEETVLYELVDKYIKDRCAMLSANGYILARQKDYQYMTSQRAIRQMAYEKAKLMLYSDVRKKIEAELRNEINNEIDKEEENESNNDN